MFSKFKFMHLSVLFVLALSIALTTLLSVTIGIQIGTGATVSLSDGLWLTFSAVNIIVSTYVLSESRKHLVTAA